MESDHPSLQPVSPSDCALAIVHPFTREQFLADLMRPDEKDFIHHFIRERRLWRIDAESSWEEYAESCWKEYEDEFVILAEAVCGEAERLGVTVCYAARLADLTALLHRYPAVALHTHLRFVQVEPKDILNAPQLLGLLQSPQTGALRAILNAFELRDRDLLNADVVSRLSQEVLAQRIANVIRAVTNKAEKLYVDEAASWSLNLEQMPDGWRDRLTRWEFEQALPECVAPALTIEFNEGLRTMPQLINAIPQDFSGMLDLTVCDSAVAANPIRHARPNCLIVGNRKPIPTIGGLYLYGLVISLLAKQPRPYIEAINQVHMGKSVYKVNEGKSWNLFKKFFGNTDHR